MLNITIFNVLNKVLDGNIESVDYYFSEGHKLQITTKANYYMLILLRKLSASYRKLILEVFMMKMKKISHLVLI